MELSVRGTPITVTPSTLVVFLLALGAAGYGGYDAVQQSTAVENARPVETTVTDTEISKSAGRGLIYRVSVEHTYQYQGTEYTSEQVFPGSTSPMFTVRSDAESIRESYEPDTTTTAYVYPNAPGRAFLERRTTLAPFRFVALGGLIALLTALHAVGAPNPGRDTTLRPEREHEPASYRTLFGLDRDVVNRLSKRLILLAPLTLAIALVATVLLASGREASSITADPTDPIGLALLTALVAGLTLVGGLGLYGIWSFTEYRRLRERIEKPRPPSPFRHPTRLVTILVTNDGLDAYGRRVKLTGFAVLVAVFVAGLLVSVVLV